MAVREVQLERIPSRVAMLSVNPSGLYWSAAFVKEHDLQDYVAVKFFMDTDDPYMLGFQFLKEPSPNSLSLVASGRVKSKNGVKKVSGFSVKAQELFSNNSVLQAIAKHKDKHARMFEITKSRNEDFFRVSFRPTFEIRVAWSEKTSIDKTLSGIYRYIDGEGMVVYIGKGMIRNRATDDLRTDWGVEWIEFSPLRTDDESFKWESYYLEEHRSKTGALPVMNRVGGRTIVTGESE